MAIAGLVLLTSCTAVTTLIKVSPQASPISPTSILWTDCSGGFQCGTVPVPLDYAHPGAGTINIAMIRKVATDPTNRIGSVLTNPGGPGASGIDFLKGEAPNMSTLNQKFDLVSFDPRGVGQSSPVRCLSGPQEDVYNALDPVFDDNQEKQAGIQADQNFAAGCQNLSPKILPFIDTVSAAKDMDLMRIALGDTKLTYLGFSYGTFLGQTYAHLYPTHVRAMVLDGVLDPSLSANDLIVAQVGGFEQNLQAFLTDCKSRKTGSSPCAYAQVGDPGTKLLALMQLLDTTPMQVGLRQLTRALAVIGVLVTLYDQSTWTYLDKALTAADKGDGTLLLGFSDVYFGRNADGTYSNETDANTAINCLDHPVPQDMASYDQLGPSLAKISPVFGPAIQYGNLVCVYWKVPATGTPGPLNAPGAPPILLVGGTNDPATPYAWAQSVHGQLANSILLTRHGNGHTSYDASACAHAAEDAYLISLTLPTDGTVCN